MTQLKFSVYCFLVEEEERNGAKNQKEQLSQGTCKIFLNCADYPSPKGNSITQLKTIETGKCLAVDTDIL